MRCLYRVANLVDYFVAIFWRFIRSRKATANISRTMKIGEIATSHSTARTSRPEPASARSSVTLRMRRASRDRNALCALVLLEFQVGSGCAYRSEPSIEPLP